MGSLETSSLFGCSGFIDSDLASLSCLISNGPDAQNRLVSRMVLGAFRELIPECSTDAQLSVGTDTFYIK